MTASILAHKLTVAGAMWGGVLGVCLFLGAGWTGVLLMAVFFVLGTGATAIGKNKKSRWGLTENPKGRRNAGQVLANGGMGGLCAAAAWLFPLHAPLFQVMAAAAFSSAAADTLSSELGSVYGRNFYHILSLKKDKRGLDGVVSAEGFLFGLAGSILITIVYLAGFGRLAEWWWIIAAGTLGNIMDSVIGAAWERRGWIQNDAVNFLNTAFAAGVAALCFYVFA